MLGQPNTIKVIEKMNKFSSVYSDWKVLAALVLIGASIWLVAPNLVTTLFPLLLIAACPLAILAFVVFLTRNRQKKQRPHIEGHLLEEQIASLKAQLLTDRVRRTTLGEDDTTSHDPWMKL